MERRISSGGNDNKGENNNNIKIAFIDPRPLVRLCISRFLETSAVSNRRCEDFVVSPFSNPEDFLSYPTRHSCNIKLILFNTGADRISEDLAREIRQLKQELQHIPLIVLSERDEYRNILEAFRHGADGYIPMTLDPFVMIQALRLVYAGGTFIPATPFLQSFDTVAEERPAMGVKPSTVENLTPRELEVIQLLKLGKPNKIIADDLQVEESTVKVHIRHILKKLRVTNRTQAALLTSTDFGAVN
ncbi:MAG: response regulator transcription factor [Nitrososphaera sp.]|nr:response regulator transcription factor [Nitrososphaera sp.]